MDLGQTVRKLEELKRRFRIKEADFHEEGLEGSAQALAETYRSLVEEVERQAKRRFEMIKPWVEHGMSNRMTRYEIEEAEAIYSSGRIGIYVVSLLPRIGEHEVEARREITNSNREQFQEVASNVGLDYITLVKPETSDRKL